MNKRIKKLATLITLRRARPISQIQHIESTSQAQIIFISFIVNERNKRK